MNASDTHVNAFLGVTAKTLSGKSIAVEMSSVTLDILEHEVGQRVATIKSATRVGHDASQFDQINRGMRRHL